MINNGSLSYDHDRDGTLTQVAGCEAKFRNVDYETHISIKYLNEKLTVLTDLENKHEWKVCFESPNVKLPTGYYFGASATTGDLSDNHDIISFKFYELEPIPDVCIRKFEILEFFIDFSFHSCRMLHWRCAKLLYHRLRFSKLPESEKKIQNQECPMLRYSFTACFLYAINFNLVCFCSIFADLLPDSIWHDLCDSFSRLWHSILPKATRIITKTVVMPTSIHRDSNRPSTNYIISIQYDKQICTKPKKK